MTVIPPAGGLALFGHQEAVNSPKNRREKEQGSPVNRQLGSVSVPSSFYTWVMVFLMGQRIPEIKQVKEDGSIVYICPCDKKKNTSGFY